MHLTGTLLYDNTKPQLVRKRSSWADPRWAELSAEPLPNPIFEGRGFDSTRRIKKSSSFTVTDVPPPSPTTTPLGMPPEAPGQNKIFKEQNF